MKRINNPKKKSMKQRMKRKNAKKKKKIKITKKKKMKKRRIRIKIKKQFNKIMTKRKNTVNLHFMMSVKNFLKLIKLIWNLWLNVLIFITK